MIAGHGRVLAAAQLGLDEAPVIVLGHLTEAQRRAYRIADNKLTELGSWDEALLLEELRGLMAEDFDDILWCVWCDVGPGMRPGSHRA